MKFTFQHHILDADRRELRRGSELIALEPQVFDLLLYLVRNRERVVSKQDLIDSVWNGRIVSDSTLTSRINAVRRALGDSGKEQRLIRTAARKGLRFVGEVREERATSDASPKASQVEPQADAPPPVIVDRPSIAVLPFENLSEDHSLELIANGLVEDIIALLARVPGFFVIARASSFIYQPESSDIQRVGGELGVRYVVTGSARSSADRVRISAQLVEAETSAQLWAGRYDVERGDMLDLQDEIARRIMTELEPALTRADLQVVRRRRTDSVDAWSHFRQAYGAIAIHGWNEESLAEALQHSRRAIAIDPDFALARALLALLNAFGTLLSLVDDRATAEHDAKEQAELAVAIDPNASDVLGFSGCALSDVGEHQRGCELLQRAVELDPSNAQAHVALGAALTQVGRVDDGIKSMQYGMRSSPKDFRLTFWSMILAHALGRADRLEEALSVAMAASRRDGRLYGARVVTAWALQRLDRPNEAREALLDARRIRPALNLDEIRRFFGKRTAADLSSIWN